MMRPLVRSLPATQPDRELPAPPAWLCLLALLATTGAQAVNTSFANRARSAVGSEVAVVASAGSSRVSYFAYGMTQGRSYHAYAYLQRGPDALGGACAVNWLDAAGATFPGAGVDGDDEPADPSADGDGFIAPVNGEFTVEATSYGAPSQAATCTLVVTETTLFSPWFYRDPAMGYDGFVEMKNTTSGSVTAVVTAFAANGAALGSATRTIPANATSLVNVSSLAGSGYGSVQVAHRGKPGAIVANLTTLSGSTGLSFDAPLVMRRQTPR